MAMRTLDPGLRLGKYEIVTHIASGGMGSVYQAIDRELRRTVALKVLPSHRAGSTNDLERFKREARHAARLSHPNIVTLYEYGYDESEDVYFLAMEFIDGYDLAHLIAKKGQLTPKDTRRILKQAAEALDHAYSQGVIHRDIKPSNFLLAKVGSKTVVKLTDMGLAIVDDDEEYRMTREGRTVGTIDYMAPEQARDSRAADIRSDIYSLGCTAYHMLAGKAPFAEGGLGERVYKHQNVPPADVRELSPSVSAAFWGVLQKMLAKQPDDRYATPGELVAALKRVSAEADDEEPELAPLPAVKPPRPVEPPPMVKAPRPAEPIPEPTPPSETMVAVTSVSDAPLPRKKLSRPKASENSSDPRRILIPVVGACVLGVAALIGWEALKSHARKTEADTRQTRKPEEPPPEGVVPGPKTPAEVRVKMTPVPVEPAVESVTMLEPFKGREWPGQELVPFGALAPRPRLELVKAVQIKGKIAMASSPTTFNITLAWEAQRRVKYQESTPLKSKSILLVGDQGWVTTEKVQLAAVGELLNFLQYLNYAVMLSDLIALTDRDFTIEKGENTVIRGLECFSIRVARANRPTVTLFFNSKSRLLLKAEYQARLVDQNTMLQPNATRVELYFSDYHNVDWMSHWHKMEQYRDGTRFSTWTLNDIRLFHKTDDALFLSDGLDELARKAMADYRKGLVKRGLALVGEAAPSELSQLVGGLSLKDPALRWTMRDAVLAYAGLWRNNQAPALQESDLPALNTLLLSKDDELPAFAIEAITRLGPQAAKSVPHLVSVGQTSLDPAILAGVIGALKSTEIKSASVLDLYVRLLAHPDSTVKIPAALALLKLGPERLDVDRVSALMAWPNAHVRDEAGRLLRQRLAAVTSKDLPMLRLGLRNPVREARLAFIDAIGSLQRDAQEATPDLLPLLTGTDKEIATQTARALDRMGKLVDLARDPGEPAVMAAALAALRGKAVKTPETLAIYETHLDHPSAAVKNAAALALIELAPERLSKERLIDFMARPRPVDFAAALALYNADPANVQLKTKGIDILVRELAPDVNDLKSFMAQPLQARPAAILLDIGGGPAVVPIVKHLLSNNNPKELPENQKIEPTAARLMGYEMLKEFAKRGKAKQDRDLIAALKKQESGLKAFWHAQETALATRLKTAKGASLEAKQLQAATVESAFQAYRSIEALRLP